MTTASHASAPALAARHTQHTPGDWTATRSAYSTHDKVETHIGTPKLTVCVVYSDPQSGFRDQVAANIPLLTAAPDLLAALEKVAHCSRYLPSQGDEMLYALEHLREIARAAIAKATASA